MRPAWLVLGHGDYGRDSGKLSLPPRVQSFLVTSTLMQTGVFSLCVGR